MPPPCPHGKIWGLLSKWDAPGIGGSPRCWLCLSLLCTASAWAPASPPCPETWLHCSLIPLCMSMYTYALQPDPGVRARLTLFTSECPVWSLKELALGWERCRGLLASWGLRQVTGCNGFLWHLLDHV